MAKLAGVGDDKRYQLIQALFRAIPGMMFHVKRDGTYLEFLPPKPSKPLFSPEKFLGKKISDIMPPEIAERQMAKIEALFATGKPQIDEYFLQESGEMRLYETRFAVSGEDTLVAVVRDITEERKAEEALRESEAELMSIFRAAPIGIGVVSNRILKQVNDRFCQMTGYSREELLGKNARLVYPTDEDYEYVGTEKYRQIRESGTGSVETRWQRKDGKIINVLLSSTPINLSNMAAGVTFTALDITKQKKAEEETRQYADKLEQRVAMRTAQLEEKTKELEQVNSQLKKADQLKSVFLASMSHELRTPLNSIIGFTGILLMELAGKLNDEQKKQIKMVKDSADHLLDLINDILDISRIEAGRVELSLEKFFLNDVFNEVTEIFSSQAAKKGLEFIVNIPGKIFLFSDMRRIKQILFNLVGNAVKFTNQGKITVSGTILPGEKIGISVEDTGIGIKEEAMDKLFNPFQQVDVNLTKQFEGSGLGLYLCKSLATLLGGEISAQSQYQKGSVFTVILPLKK